MEPVLSDVADWTFQLKELSADHDFTVSSELVELLSKIYDKWKAAIQDESLQAEIVRAVDSKEGADVLVRIISILSDTEDVSTTTEDCLCKCYCILWDFSDTRGSSFLKNLMNTCIVGQCVGNLRDGEKLKEKQTGLDIIKASLGILYNISREATAESVLAGVEWSFLVPYKEGSNEYIKAMSAMILAFISDEKTKGIQGEKDTTIYMVRLLREAKESPDRRKQGFSCTELIEGLSRLALNDDNKLTVQQAGGVSLLITIIQGHGVADEETTAAAQCLWTLAFITSVQTELQGYKEQLQIVSKSSCSERLTKAVNGVLLTLASSGELAANTIVADSDDKDGGHIMISYSWDAGYGQRTARKIAVYLKSLGFKVWIDVDEMKGSILDAMADAVNKSNVFILCVSDGYRKSNNCRLEAKYAHNSKKPIIPVILGGSVRSRNDWLRMLCSDNLYIEFTEGNIFPKQCEELVQQISRLTKESDDVDAPVSRVPQLRRSNTQYTSTDTTYWGPDDVSNWLLEKDLQSFAETFQGFDGNNIQALRKIRTEAPEFFYRCLWECDDESKRRKLISLLKLSRALDDM